MVGTIDEVLTELGWDDGFRIPIANDENKSLEEEIDRKSKLKASLKAKLSEIEDRVSDIKKYATDLRLGHGHNQKLITAYSSQMEAENHLYQLSQSSESKLNQDIRQYHKETADIKQKIDIMQQNMTKLMERLDNAKKKVSFDRNQLQKWEETLSREEEDNRLIEKYMKLDEKKFKELELRRQKLKNELKNYQEGILKKIESVHDLEVSLDKTSKMYTYALKERQQLINQWTQSVIVLRQRDNTIYDTLREITTLRETAKGKLELYQDAEKFLKAQQANNAELNYHLTTMQKEIAMTKDEHRKLSKEMDKYSIHIHLLRKSTQDFVRSTRNINGRIAQKKNELEKKSKNKEDTIKLIRDLTINLQNITENKVDAAERTKQLEDILAKEEKRKNIIIKDLTNLQNRIIASTHRLAELEHEKMTAELQHQNEIKQIGQLEMFYNKQESILKGKKELMYNLDFTIQKSEIRLQYITGQERDSEESEKKNQRVEELQKSYNGYLETSKILQTQLASLEHEMRKTSNSLAINNDELERLKYKKQEFQVLNDGGEKQLKTAQCNNEEKQVDENILRLRVSQAEKLMYKVDDKLYSLEKFRLEMESAMQERKVEIRVQKDALNLKKRIYQSDCADLRSGIVERNAKIQQLQIRHELLSCQLGYTPDGVPVDNTYLKIQSAQERYLLKEHGDELDQTIKKVEEEIKCMENTLRVVNVCNAKYKTSLSVVDEDGPEKIEQKKLDEEMSNAIEMLRQKRTELDNKVEDLKKMKENYIVLLKDIESVIYEKERKEQCVMNLERQITEQKEKILRADKNLRKVFKEIQNMCICTTDETILLQERDIATRELQEKNTLALQHIAEFTIRHVEAEAYVKKLLAANNISLPSISFYQNKSSTSSRCSSAASFKSRIKLGSTLSLQSTSRESIGSVLNIEPTFSKSPPSTASSTKSSEKIMITKCMKSNLKKQ